MNLKGIQIRSSSRPKIRIFDLKGLRDIESKKKAKIKIFPFYDSKKRNFNNPSGTGCCWHIFTAFIKLLRIIKWKNFALKIFRI